MKFIHELLDICDQFSNGTRERFQNTQEEKSINQNKITFGFDERFDLLIKNWSDKNAIY